MNTPKRLVDDLVRVQILTGAATADERRLYVSDRLVLDAGSVMAEVWGLERIIAFQVICRVVARFLDRDAFSAALRFGACRQPDPGGLSR